MMNFGAVDPWLGIPSVLETASDFFDFSLAPEVSGRH